ncbi:MAG TPA: S41 family peptidase [Stellaceae bacterium]
MSAALAACAGHQQTASSSPDAVFTRGLDQIGQFYIEPVSTRHVALAGIARLSRIDDKLAVSDTGAGAAGEGFGLNYDGQSIAYYSMPADGNNRDWGQLLGSLTATARQASSRLAALPEEAVEKAVFDGMTGSLDHYSRYATPKTARNQRAERDGYSGIGLTLEAGGNSFRVALLCPRGPAEQAGIRPGDELLAVDGMPTAGQPQDAIMDQMRGPVGSMVTVSIRQGIAARQRDLTLQRAFVTLPTVTTTRDGNIAVFRITSFNQATTERLGEELAKAQRDAGGHLAGIVLDLRGDPGGLLDQAVSLADLFLKQGPIASTTGRHPASRQAFAASGHAAAPEIPIAVLVNGGSASAAEIVAAALQDHGRAVVIGSSSYGKGTVQTVLHLPNDGELILTWARLLTPSGRLLQANGVVPTVCTSDLADNETSVQSALQRVGAARSRQACPARPTKPAIDVKIAERLLADPRLYSQALQAGRSASLVPRAPEGGRMAAGLTERAGSLSSEPRQF